MTDFSLWKAHWSNLETECLIGASDVWRCKIFDWKMVRLLCFKLKHRSAPRRRFLLKVIVLHSIKISTNKNSWSNKPCIHQWKQNTAFCPWVRILRHRLLRRQLPRRSWRKSPRKQRSYGTNRWCSAAPLNSKAARTVVEEDLPRMRTENKKINVYQNPAELLWHIVEGATSWLNNTFSKKSKQFSSKI